MGHYFLDRQYQPIDGLMKTCELLWLLVYAGGECDEHRDPVQRGPGDRRGADMQPAHKVGHSQVQIGCWVGR